MKIHWNSHLIPFIEAQTDRDLAFSLGLVHAHLRLTQVGVMRQIALGRLSECTGPFGWKLDRSIRSLQVCKPVPEIVRTLPPETRCWVEAYVAGLNHYQASTKELPRDFKLLNLPLTPYTVSDIIAMGRTRALDATWPRLFEILKLSSEKCWPAIWSRMIGLSSLSRPSFENKQGPTGSNAWAVAGKKSQSGGALIASDPHLDFFFPGIWMIGGIKSPSYHAVGLMTPGLPVIAIGRNEHIGWGATSMYGESTEIVELKGEKITKHRERLPTRWGFSKTIHYDSCRFAPILQQKSQHGHPLALRWVGHAPSDEMSTFMKLNRARNWPEFREAFSGYTVSSRNMIYADTAGNIGQLLAATLPKKTESKTISVTAEESDRNWSAFHTPDSLPASFNPESGILASANNLPTPISPPLTRFLPGNDRIDRILDLLEHQSKISTDDFKRIQQDLFSSSSHELAKAFTTHFSAESADILAELKQWDGNFGTDSRGALAFHLLYREIALEVYGRKYGRRISRFLLESDLARDLLKDDHQEATITSLRKSMKSFRRYRNWGDFHRFRYSHLLSRIPFFGKKFVLADIPMGGSSTTVCKMAHANSASRVDIEYGASARFVADLKYPDENYFVILGGQDGWLWSEQNADQIPLFAVGKYIRVPLSMENVAEDFPIVLELLPNP